MGAAANESSLEGLRVQVVAVSAAAGTAMRAAGQGAGSVQQYVKQWSKLDPRYVTQWIKLGLRCVKQECVKQTRT